jgi:hypothetical protein
MLPGTPEGERFGAIERLVNEMKNAIAISNNSEFPFEVCMKPVRE